MLRIWRKIFSSIVKAERTMGVHNFTGYFFVHGKVPESPSYDNMFCPFSADDVVQEEIRRIITKFRIRHAIETGTYLVPHQPDFDKFPSCGRL
jgi:hypothetical protein